MEAFALGCGSVEDDDLDDDDDDDLDYAFRVCLSGNKTS